MSANCECDKADTSRLLGATIRAKVHTGGFFRGRFRRWRGSGAQEDYGLPCPGPVKMTFLARGAGFYFGAWRLSFEGAAKSAEEGAK